jgi:SAM-dependent methyltransferase
MDFDRFASDYDEALEKGISLSGESRDYFARGRVAEAASYLQDLGVRPRKIVDFGCGTGDNILALREDYPDAAYCGLDISDASLEVAKDRLKGLDVELETPSRYAGGPVDWAFCNGVFHHIPVQERASSIRFLRSILRTGGFLSIFENNPFNPGARLVMRRIPFDREAKMINPYRLRSMLADEGFERVVCRFLFVFPRFLSLLRPAESRLTRLPLGAQYGAFGVRGPA